MAKAKLKESKEPTVIQGTIDMLIPDDKNFNKGTEYGAHLIEKSFRELGAGRSILLDKNNRIIAGNKSTETAAAIGMEDVIIVETDGTKLIAVKRMDIDLDSKAGRELAMADNATTMANVAWDEENIAEVTAQWEIKQEDWGVKDMPKSAKDEEDERDPFADEGVESQNKFGVIVMCDNEEEQEKAFNELKALGYRCKVVVV